MRHRDENQTEPVVHLVLETKGFDPLGDVKRAAADRWVAAVNADGTYGKWAYRMAKKTTEVADLITAVAAEQEVAVGQST